MARGSLVALVLGPAMLLAACWSPAPAKGPDTLYRSGSRLRARFTDAGSGARRFDGWWDSKLATPCEFRFAEDDVRRCIPMPYSVRHEPLFTDPACTLPVVSWVDPSQPVHYATMHNPRVFPPAVCGADLATLATAPSGGVASSWRIVGGAQPAPPAFYLRHEGACRQVIGAPTDPVYPIEKVAPTELVATIRTRVEPRGASLAIQMFDHDDGSSMAGELYDVALVRGCFPSWSYGVSDDYRCYGSPVGLTTCVPGAPENCAGDLLFGAVDACTPPAAFTRLGNGTCDTVEAARLPELASDLLGSGRVRLAITHAPDDARPLLVNPSLFQNDGRYIRGPFFDTERQLACDPQALGDGGVRCLTQEVITADIYSDAACTHLLAAKIDRSDPCPRRSQPPTPRYALGGSPARIYELGAEVHPAQLYRLVQTNPPICNYLSYTVADAYEVTPADANLFATLEVGTE